MRTVALPETDLPAKLTLHPERGMTEDEYFNFCAANPNVRFERTSQGEIIIVPPAGGESSFRRGDAFAELRNWARRDGRGRFLALAPEFVIEVMSPSDRLLAMQAKMQEWVDNGVQLAWLIDGDARMVYVYRPGAPPEIKKGIRKLAGDGPVKGFVLDLTDIWAGL